MKRTACFMLAALAASCGDQRLTTLQSQSPGAAGTTGGATDGGSSGGCQADLVGYALVVMRTEGGKGGQKFRVTTPAALLENAKAPETRIIEIEGMITVSGGPIPVASNKTIVGVGPDSGLEGGGFNVADAENVIIQNVKIRRAPIDAIQIYRSHHVWIDHCDLSSELHPTDGQSYDGLLDIVHGSDFVTVSWTRFHDHKLVSLVGHSDDPENAAEDMGKLNVTYHHNFFSQTERYNPSIRFGVLHAYNNYYFQITERGISSRMGARTLAEANFFETVPNPLSTDESSNGEGFITEKSTSPNFYNDSQLKGYTKGTDVPIPYPYGAETAEEALDSVPKCAGTTLVF